MVLHSVGWLKAMKSLLSSVSSKSKYDGINLDDIHRTITPKRIKLNIYIF